jgi:predicted 3-demethylubiquinone-9 3-methyltransferase (glyoxalase superfamily)
VIGASIDARAPTSLHHIEAFVITTQRMSICLWFDRQAEEAANYYVGIFKNSKIRAITRYGTAGSDQHHMPPGTVMTVAFDLDGQSFTGLNAGPIFTFNEAVSIQVNCATQEEIDYYWEKLTAGGDPKAQVCGWLKDKYGLTWQVVPNDSAELFSDEKSPGTQRAMEAMMQMKKIDIAALRRAKAGKD